MLVDDEEMDCRWKYHLCKAIEMHITLAESVRLELYEIYQHTKNHFDGKNVYTNKSPGLMDLRYGADSSLDR